MFPPIAQIAQADADVRAVLKTGNGPVRFWPFADAPQKGNPGYGLPYAVFQTVTGTPENYLGERPDIDSMTEQVDVYAATVASARAVAQALRDAFEGVAHITAWRGESVDPDTDLRRFSFDVEFWTPR